MPRIADITAAIEAEAPLCLQESWDNSGLQTGHADAECTGVMIALDPSVAAIDEAVAAGCNLLVTHHPLFFHKPERIVGATAQQRIIEWSISRGVAVYSAHTSLDAAPNGLNRTAAEMLGLTDITPLEASATIPGAGMGAVGNLPSPLSAQEFIELVKATFGSPTVRCSAACDRYHGDNRISRVALCTGSGSSMIAAAKRAGADAYITSDTSYHLFADHVDEALMIADIGHHESESHARDILMRIISEKFPNFAVRMSNSDTVNPIAYA